MTLWLLPIAVVAVGIVAIVAALRIRSRRASRLQLRLLAGRRRLLTEEIADHQARLEALRDAAEAPPDAVADGIDHLQTRLVDREAHLLNLEDLARLQQHKMTVLARHLDELSAPVAAGEPPEAELEDDAGILERRDRLEDKLLQRIQERGTPPRRRRRR